MHRTIEITVSAAATQRLLEELEQINDVIGLSIQRGASIKPLGDVIVVHVLNRGADAVLARADAARQYGTVSVVTSEIASIIDPERDDLIERDIDEAIWEEMETGLRHQAQVTPNYLALMALGGIIAAVGLVSEGTAQAVAFVACSVIAPGFEPLAKIPLGFVLGRWNVVRRGLVSTLIGYTVLILSATGAFLLLHQTGAVSVEKLVANPEVINIANPELPNYLVSLCAASAGMIMIAAYRRSVIAGPLIALVLIQAAALAGVAISTGEWALLVAGLQRLGTDMLLIVAFGAFVVWIKQRMVHQRLPMV